MHSRQKDDISSVEARSLREYLSGQDRKCADLEVGAKDLLEKRKRVLGLDHPDTLRSLHELGKLYEKWGKFDLAEAFLVDALEGRSNIVGADHLDTIATRNDLSALRETKRT
ncbi:hypothetical protein HDV00_010844 [Rhizophlyctis rosea]|nr:hypothetical protein HDV00_010844 [Rhizophlyctis rosea]